MMFKELFKPGQLGKIHTDNRVLMAPMVTGFASNDGKVTDKMIDYYLKRVKGGVRTTVIESCYSSYIYPGRLSIMNDDYIPNLKKLSEKLKNSGSKVILQINPSRGRDDTIDSISASDVPNPFTGIRPKVLEIKEIKEIVISLSEAAIRAKKSGFDGVMFHGGSGYLISEFLSPLTNQRVDEYGGTVEKRARFAIEILHAAREKVGEDYLIMFRLMCDDHLKDGVRGSIIQICHLLEKHGADAIDAVSGSAETFEWRSPSSYFPKECNVNISKMIKDYINIPISVTGRITNPVNAEKILKDQLADFIGLGRALIADPMFLTKTAKGVLNDIRECIACVHCTHMINKGSPVTCSINPFIDNEIKTNSNVKKKKILVIGGGLAGIETARIAAKKEHCIEIWEKEDKLGGQLNLATVPPFKKEFIKILEWEKYQINKYNNIKVILNKEANLDTIVDYRPDAVVMATGAELYVPNVPGLKKQLSNNIVITFMDVLGNKIQISDKKVIVMGGGRIGLEVADYLAEQGNQVIITTRSHDISNNLPFHIKRIIIRRLMKQNVIRICGVNYRIITNNSLVLYSNIKQKNISIETDHIVLATGMRSNRKLYKELLQKNGIELYEVGDCVNPSNIYNALKNGRECAYFL